DSGLTSRSSCGRLHTPWRGVASDRCRGSEVTYRRSRVHGWRTAALVAAAMAALAFAPARAVGAFQLGLQDPGFTDPATNPESQFAYNALRTVHGSTIRIAVNWNSVAPLGK